MTIQKAVFGVDIGGVTIARTDDNADTSFFGKNYLQTPEVEGAFETMRRLSDAGVCIHMVSKCGKNTERKTLEWLAYHNFYARTLVEPGNVHFCRQRDEKAAICQTIGATHFIDDRLEVLWYLRDLPHLYLINSDPREVSKFAHFLSGVTPVSSWADLLPLMLTTAGSPL